MRLSSAVYFDGTGAVTNDTDDSSSAVASVKHIPALELKRLTKDILVLRDLGMSTESDDV